jgi:hypothetical protein
MASTASPLLKVELQVTGENASTWGAKANVVFKRLEEAIGGITNIAVTGSNYTLDDTQYNVHVDGSNASESHVAMIKATGILTGNRTIIVPLRTKEYWIHNGCTGAYTLIVIGASGTGHTLPQTAWTCVVCDGTNVDAKSLPVDNDGSLVGNLSIVGSVTATVDSSATNTVTTIGTLTSTSTGTPAAGIGAGLDFVTETSAANNEIGGVIESVTTDVDPTNEDFDMVFKTMLSGDAAAEFMRGRSDGTTLFGGVQTIAVDSAATNAVTVVSTLTSTSSGTPANGIGVGQSFITETAAANNEIGGVIESVTTDVDPTNEDFDMVFKTMLSGDAAAEFMRGRSDRSVLFSGNVDLGGTDLKNIGAMDHDTTDKGSVSSGTVTFSAAVDGKQKLTVTGSLTIAFSNWASTGHYSEVEVMLVNGGSATVTHATVNWAVGDGTTSTTFSDTGITLASSGTNHLIVWTTDGGTTLYGVAS